MKNLLSIVVLLLFSSSVFCQYDDVLFRDHIYVTNIKSAKLYLNGSFLSNPILDLNERAKLLLEFDDIDGDVKDYTYSFVHCNKDWQPSELNYNEYANGFDEEEIRDFETSGYTQQDYTHYELMFPNEEFSFRVSGNFLLIIYEDEAEKIPVITKRLMVVDKNLGINAKVVPPRMVDKFNTHQELDVNLNVENTTINNPYEDISISILQNGRWDKAIENVYPNRVNGDLLLFEYVDKLVFPGGKEFRNVDLRSITAGTEDMIDIKRYTDGYSVVLKQQKPRTYQDFFTEPDINGKFILDNFEFKGSKTKGEYARVLFSLMRSEPYQDKDVYLFGEFTDWEIHEDFKMVYDTRVNGYLAEITLKQGFYDYIFASSSDGINADESQIEGDWYETSNDYLVLVYHRPFGARYDHLVGAFTASSD